MTRLFLIACCLTFTAAAPALADGRSQLAASLGLNEAQAAQLSTTQLALLKHVTDSSTLSEGDKRRRIRAILDGTVPRLQLRF